MPQNSNRQEIKLTSNKHETEKFEEKAADNIVFGDIVKIGILLPLSGENKTLGRSISNALEMALFETKSKNIKLLFKDSGDSLKKATEAAQEAVKEGASIIVGPVFSFYVSEIRKHISTNSARETIFIIYGKTK